MNNINWQKTAYVFLIIGSLQFIILTIIAMFFYQGGTYINSSTSKYLFWNNFFSDLGRTIAHSGISNKISFILFTTTMVIWGMSQIPFFMAILNFFKQDKLMTQLSLGGSILGIIAGISYIGIAFTPSDTLNEAHNLFVLLAFSSIFLSIIIYSITIYHNENYSDYFSYTLAIAASILTIYYIVLFIFPKNTTQEGLVIHVIGQKIAVYTLLITGIIQGYGALLQIKSYK
jgi:hypothetical protein